MRQYYGDSLNKTKTCQLKLKGFVIFIEKNYWIIISGWLSLDDYHWPTSVVCRDSIEISLNWESREFTTIICISKVCFVCISNVWHYASWNRNDRKREKDFSIIVSFYNFFLINHKLVYLPSLDIGKCCWNNAKLPRRKSIYFDVFRWDILCKRQETPEPVDSPPSIGLLIMTTQINLDFRQSWHHFDCWHHS